MARAVRRWQPDLQVAKMVNDRTQGMLRDLDGRQRYRQLEAPPFRAAGIQIKHPIDLTDLRNVRMAGYNCVHSGCGRIEVVGNVIAKQLRQIFAGAVPPDVKQRFAGLSLDELEAMSERVIGSDLIEDILTVPAPSTPPQKI